MNIKDLNYFGNGFILGFIFMLILTQLFFGISGVEEISEQAQDNICDKIFGENNYTLYENNNYTIVCKIIKPEVKIVYSEEIILK